MMHCRAQPNSTFLKIPQVTRLFNELTMNEVPLGEAHVDYVRYYRSSGRDSAQKVSQTCGYIGKNTFL